MLDIIKKALFDKYAPEDIYGIFLSAYDSKGLLQASYGVLQTPKTLAETIDVIYQGLFSDLKASKYFVIDVVRNIEEENDVQKVLQSDTKQYGICLVGEDRKGVMLPNTQGVGDMKQALQTVKQKNAINGKVHIYLFATDRMEVHL